MLEPNLKLRQFTSYGDVCVHSPYRLAAKGIFVQVLKITLTSEARAGSACLSLRSSESSRVSDVISLRIVSGGPFAGALAAVKNFGQGVSNIFKKPIEVRASLNNIEASRYLVIHDS